MTDGIEWSTKMKVGEAIIDLLSGRIYRTLPIAMKELVSNAWDADAESVQIFIHEDKKQIAIIDGGKGMTKEELKNYVNVAITSKPKKQKSAGGRPIIGHYGIGVLSALPFCRKIIIQTTVEGSDEINFLTITSDKWIDDEGHRKPPSEKELTVKFPGRTEHDNRFLKEHGTTILLEDIFPGEWNFITEPANPHRKDYMGFDGIKRIKWFLQQYAPIEYDLKAHPYVEFFKPPKSYKPMNLFFNGEQLFRNAIGRAKELERNEKATVADGKVVFRYLIVSPMRTVEPEDLRGLQLRMKNVAIGLPTHFEIYKRSAKLYGRMKYIGGEIEILKGFENQLSLDRENIITCPEWLEFSEFFRDKLVEHANSLQDLADAEATLGALAVSSGVSPKKAEYGFLSEKAVRPSTKKKRASSAKSKKDLKEKTKKTMQKVGYKIEEISKPKNDTIPISVDHKKKVVYIASEREEDFPLVSTSDGSIFEIETIVDEEKIAKMIDDKSIAFNYGHPLFTISKDRKTIKEIISIVYILRAQEKITEAGLKAFNRMLLEIYNDEED